MALKVVIGGRTDGDVKLDMTDSNSIERALTKIGKLDAIICIAREAKWAPFDDLSAEDYFIGFRSKLMGQGNLVRLGRSYLNNGGSITLSTGILADDSVVKTANAAMLTEHCIVS